MRRLIDWLVANEGLVLILALVFILRIPSWYEPYWYGDEGIYLTLGDGLRRGLIWYRDLHDNKPPLLYLLAAISGNVFYFRIMLTLVFGAAVALFFKLMKLLLPQSEKSWYLSTLALVVLTTIFEGNIANAEIFMTLPTLIGMWLFLKGKKLVKAGFWFSLAALFKVPAGFDWLAAFLFKPSLRLLVGFTVPILATLAHYAVVGGFEPYLRSALLQNVGYLSSWGGSNQGLMWRGLGLAFGLAILWVLAKKWRLESKFKLITYWFLLALFGALLSARPYPHYLIQPAVPAAILLGYFLAKKQLKFRAIIAGLFLVGVVAYIQIGFWHYPILKYYQNFLSYAFGQKDRLNYWRYFDPRVPQTYALADYLKETTLPDESVFIWGDEPMVYALAKRLPPGRYTTAYHVADFNGYQETMAALTANPPRVIIMPEYEPRPFPELEAKIATNYIYVTKIDQAVIYRYLNGNAN